MRSHRRRSPLAHALVVGTVDDLPGIELVVGLLPADAYGQVVVEAAPDEPLPALHVPARVTVHRVAPGALGAAVAGWVAEWAPDEPDASRSVSIWVGTAARPRVDLHDAGIGHLVELL